MLHKRSLTLLVGLGLFYSLIVLADDLVPNAITPNSNDPLKLNTSASPITPSDNDIKNQLIAAVAAIEGCSHQLQEDLKN